MPAERDVEFVELTEDCTLLYEFPMTVLCPLTKERDHGTVQLEIDTNGKRVRTWNIKSLIREFETQELLPEQTVCQLARTIFDLIAPQKVQVQFTFPFDTGRIGARKTIHQP